MDIRRLAASRLGVIRPEEAPRVGWHDECILLVRIGSSQHTQQGPVGSGNGGQQDSAAMTGAAMKTGALGDDCRLTHAEGSDADAMVQHTPRDPRRRRTRVRVQREARVPRRRRARADGGAGAPLHEATTARRCGVQRAWTRLDEELPGVTRPG